MQREVQSRALLEESQQEFAQSFTFGGLISDVCLFYRWKSESDGVARILKVKNETTNGEEVKYIQCVPCDAVFVNMQYFIDRSHERQTCSSDTLLSVL